MKLISTLLASCALLLAGCINLPRYTPAEPGYSLPPPPPSTLSIVVLLEPVFPGKPFSEVVCDNVVGAIWSPAEATQIGFTQKYAETLGKRSPQLAMLATLPPNIAIGLTASGSAGSFNISTRIMVPYGRFLATNLGQLLATGSKRSRVCLDADCVERAKSAGSIDRIVTVRVNKLRVAEEKVNRITLDVQAMVTVFDAKGQISEQTIRSNIADRSITSEGFFHSDFLRTMNKAANEISSRFVEQVYVAAVK